ncbi:MAG: two-component sensor histidine kinase [Rubellimicrobium sp.]|nr:two-component sensor histidine kinase [Rubellimicrobium sp.]
MTPEPDRTAAPGGAVLLDALPMPAILIAPGGRIAALNPAARAAVPAAGAGRHHVAALRQPALLAAIEDCLTRGRTGEGRYRDHAGGRDWRVSVAPVADAGWGGQGALLTFADTTGRDSADRSRRDFVANLGHELRTPITSILGFAQTLRGPARDDAPARERFLTLLESEAARMAALVEALMSLGRIEADGRQRPEDPVELGALIRGTAATLVPQAGARGCRIDCVVPDHPVTVPGDAGQLRQVLVNLVENALKYGAAGGPVTVTLSEVAHDPALGGAAVHVGVTDRGEGIAPEHLPRLTERFYRVDNHRSREVGGSGLGLAIVHHIVDRHRGRLRIDSAPGKGSTFRVILPAGV